MVLEPIRNLVSDEDPTPNKFTIAIGELIREARIQAGLSQKELAEKIYRKQTTVSDFEKGKIEVNASTLALLAASLKKPLTYFFPSSLYRELKQEEFTPLEHELLLHFRNIWDENLQKVAIYQVKVLGDFDPKTMIWDLVDIVADQKERDQEIKKYLEKRGKKD